MFEVTEATLVSYGKCSFAGTDLYFTLEDCPTGRVINIQSAEIGFYRLRESCQPWVNASCLRSTNHQDITSCNRKQRCRFSAAVLSFPQGQTLCSDHEDGNFVWITYNCITGTRQLSRSHGPLSVGFIALQILYEIIRCTL